jgi:hypothetical protein
MNQWNIPGKEKRIETYGLPKDSDNSQLCQIEQGPLSVPLMTHLKSDNTAQKKMVTSHETFSVAKQASSLPFSLKMT